MSRRRTNSIQPCECCGFPISERHHHLPYAFWGETRFSTRLCPNCHTIFHAYYRFIREKSPEGSLTSNAVCRLMEFWGDEDPKTVYIIKLAWYAISLEEAAKNDGALAMNAVFHMLSK